MFVRLMLWSFITALTAAETSWVSGPPHSKPSSTPCNLSPVMALPSSPAAVFTPVKICCTPGGSIFQLVTFCPLRFGL